MSTLTAEPTQEQVRALREHLENLAAERRHTLSPDMLTRTLTIPQIERMISFLERQPYNLEPPASRAARTINGIEAAMEARRNPQVLPGQSLPPNKYFIFIPPGRYAVPSLTGNNDLDFFETEHGKDGTKWEGFTFVERIIGGHENATVRGEQARRYLKAIEDYGWEASRLLAAQELGVCMDCGNSLTDEESRRRGKGPVCATK